jgi:hypothetical protein
MSGSEVQFLETLDAATEWEAQKALLRATNPARPFSHLDTDTVVAAE